MKKTFVIGVGGATQSGKTTFVKELSSTLQDVALKVFHLDDYHKAKDKQPLAKAPITKKPYIDFNSLTSFDLPQLRSDLKNEIETSKLKVIIVEGTLILYDEGIFEMLDLKLFVDTKPEERAIRYIELYSQFHGHDFIKNSYLDLVRYRMDEYVEPTKWRADIILNGSEKSAQAVEVIKSYLEQFL